MIFTKIFLNKESKKFLKARIEKQFKIRQIKLRLDNGKVYFLKKIRYMVVIPQGVIMYYHKININKLQKN